MGAPLEHLVYPAYFQADPYITVFDLRKAERLLGWQPAFSWRDIDELEF